MCNSFKLKIKYKNQDVSRLRASERNDAIDTAFFGLYCQGLQVNQLRTAWKTVVYPWRQLNKKIVASGATGALQTQRISRYTAHLTHKHMGKNVRKKVINRH